jgi:murein DD-endopeptidase MepM/ murein hydrolase activator NlpD
MRRKFVLLAASATILGASGAATLAGSAAATPSGAVGGGPDAALRCVAPADAQGIDAILTSAGSPLAGQGTTFVNEGVRAGIDPRLLVAIAAQESILGTYGPSQPIHNPFGLGPGMAFTSEAAAIAYAAQQLGANYIADGLTTIPEIAGKWAPPGAGNDPSGLNLYWPTDVSHYYQALGGDPSAPVTLTTQPAGCGSGTDVSAASTAAAPLITIKPLGTLTGTYIQGPADPGGTHDPQFNLSHGSYNWQSIWAVDLGVPIGTPVYAAFSGTIVTVHSGETGRFAGISVGLDSGRGLAAYYAHLSQVDVTAGQSVVAGQLIGATGAANGVDHLHFALGRSYADGSPANGLNPLPFLGAASPTVQAAELKLASTSELAPGSGTPVVTVWGGNRPQTLGPGPAGGSTPGTDTPATISPFAFPIAQPSGGQVRYVAPACTVGASCQVEVATPSGADVVAATPGTLEAATAAERAQGIAFWIDTPGAGRIGYGPLTSYAAGIGPGATVKLGQPLGTSAGALAFAWENGGVAINPWPMLTAVRPSD